MDLIGVLWNTIVYDPMLNALLFIYSFIPNYGLAIILFTILIALATMPFRIKAQAAMKKQQEKMATLKPKLDELKKKYKDNPQQLQQAQMKLYQEHGLANPLNMGCLLTLLPLPIFIGLYNVILSVMGDRPEQTMQLAQHIYPSLGYFAALIPVNSNFWGLNLALPPSTQGILVTIVMVGLVVGTSWVQSRMMGQPSAAMDPQQAQMNQSMQLMMPLLFGFFVLNAPTGLSLYWITFSVMGIIQQYLTSGWGGLFTRATPQPLPAKQPSAGVMASRSTAPISSNGDQNPPGAPPRVESASKGKKKSGKKRKV